MAARNPRVRVVVPPLPNLKDKKEIWTTLRAALEKIQKCTREGKSRKIQLSYQELYKMTYNLVMGQETDMLYDGLDDVVRTYLKEQVEAILLPEAQNFCLRRVTELYDDHCETMHRFRDVLLYMDSRRGRSQQTVFDLGMTCFAEEVIKLETINERMKAEMLHEISKSRRSEEWNWMLVQKATSMLVNLSSSNNLGNRPRHIYLDVFQAPFLNATKEYYDQKSQMKLNDTHCVEYLKWASACIEEEVSLVKKALDATTIEDTSRLLHETLVGTYKVSLVEDEDVKKMLHEGNIPNLRILFQLLSKVPQGMVLLQERLQSHILQAGSAALASEATDSDHSGPVKLLSGFTEEMAKYATIQTKAFDKDPDIQLAINKPFKKLLNQHKSIAEYLSLYIDNALKTHAMERDDDNKLLDAMVWIFRLIQEKDVFERFYKQHLAKRMLHSKIDSETEQRIIQRLKVECGGEYTQRFEAMFKDFKVSDDLMSKFWIEIGETAKKLGRMDLDVRVLATNAWPSTQASMAKLPKKLEQVKEVYEEFYHRQHKGRKLAWQTSLGMMTLGVKFGKLKMVHIITMTTLQGLIMLLFNGVEGDEVKSISFEDMQAELGITIVELRRALRALCQSKYRLLVKTDGSNPKEFSNADSFTLNTDFTSKKTKIKIPQIVVKETPTEAKVTQVKVAEDRRMQIEACIVRVMKARKTLQHNDLVIEATAILSPRFSPNVQSIKQTIERLIDAEYIERSSTDQKIYNYLA